MTQRGQSILEYTMIIGILTVVLFYMGTSIKRGMQSLVKVTADQVGNQQQADQDFNNPQAGYMVSSVTNMSDMRNKQITEIGYIDESTNSDRINAIYFMNSSFDERTDSNTETITNGGFQPT